jgi:hypothetical protein
MLQIILSIVSIILALTIVVVCFFSIGKAKLPEKITWGVDFSQMQAESLGLDWKQTYLALLNNLGAKNIKIHTQWDWIEGQQNSYFFDDTDWQINQAKNNGANVIYVVGLKSGRWPECHIPEWTKDLTEQQVKDELLKYISAVVLRYKNNSAITYWQVENEPFFKFGECPAWYYKNSKFLKEEVDLVKSLDPSRQVIVSDSGEGSMWFGAAKVGDIVGTTMYRKAWAHITNKIGFYFHYLFSPVYYARKALLIDKIFGKDVICIELQAEPWASKPFYDVPLAEQEKTMNLKIFKQDIEYAKETGLDTFYFWGSEWWYWMKEKQNKPEIWNEVKKLFQN